MKTSANKILKYLFNFQVVDNLKKKLNKQTILAGILVLSFLTTTFYFVRPNNFDFILNKQFIEKKIQKVFNLESKINGNISYNLLPSPRLVITKINLNLDKRNKKAIFVDEINILLSPFKLRNLKSLNYEKFLILNQKVKVQPEQFINYINYLSLDLDKSLAFKNSEIFFKNTQGESVSFENFNLKKIFKNGVNKINSDGIFSKNKIKIKFTNEPNKKKFFKASIPNLNMNLDIIFDQQSSLENLSGQMRVDLLETILMLNFSGKKNFILTESFFRNKFLNSQLKGNISFEDNFFFDLNFMVNKIDLRKLLFYYFSSDNNRNPLISGISKKINGKIKIQNKSSNSFIGKINNTEATLVFENGNVKIENISSDFSRGAKLDMTALFRDVEVDPLVDFSLNFSTVNAKKFFRRFDLYDVDEKALSFFVKGSVNLEERKIKFKEIIKNNNERMGKKNILFIEKEFNENVIDTSILDLFDFFKLKKFAKQTVYIED